MLFEKMCWMDVEDYLKHDDRVVMIIGSCEQHAYLSLATDVLEPLEIAKAACDIENVPIIPTVNYGLNPFFANYPGNISLTIETFTRLVTDIVESLISQGFKKILISNGHGGNTGVLSVLLDEISNRHDDVRISLFQWWLHPDVDKVATDTGLKQAHANWSEHHSFTHVRKVPSEPKEFVILPKVANCKEIRKMLGDGCTGGYYEAPDEVMKRFFDAAVRAMTEELRKL
jgi:creatinine amidohydrolase